MRHEDYCTFLVNAEDRDILTRRLFDVNMRLFHSSPQYRKIVVDCAAYMLWCAQTKKDGYKKPHGYSGANAGIPFNIIATPDEAMLNPHILSASSDTVDTLSNCGSLLLPEPIKVRRYADICFEYFDVDGVLQEKRGRYLTVQHEVDHNNGILITDRTV